jgi:uroporphyrin-3 C-methyltransferase
MTESTAADPTAAESIATQAGSPPATPEPTANPAPGGASAPGGGARALAGAALVVAAAALSAALYQVQASRELAHALDQEHADNLARDQRAADRDRRLADIEHQWAQAQADADMAAGPFTEADLRRRREQLALIDIERVVEQAQLQLRLGAPVGAAIDALAAADARLARLAGAAPLKVQAALRHDLARLKAAPDPDRGLLAARLDPLIAAVDEWHASADATHPMPRPVPPAARPGGPAAGAAPPKESFGAEVRAWIMREFGDLVRIREIDTPEALRLAPVQQQILRDRFRLGILALREALLARDERTIRSEESALEALLAHYFDPNQPGVAAAVAQLRATASAALSAPAPSLDETLAALRAARGANGGAPAPAAGRERP